MYEALFGLARRPFASAPYPAEYFPAATSEAVRRTLGRCIERAEGAGMVVGPSGTGKTLLCEILAEQFRGRHETVVLASGRLSTRRALLQAILHGLGQSYRGIGEGELRLALVDYLGSTKRCPYGMLLVVDEAHTLSVRLLDEIRMLTNVVSDGRPHTRLVLAGNPLLEEHLASPRLESLSQRLVSRCYLEPLTKTETEQYIYSCLDKAGGQGPVLFSAEACQAVHQATDGVPRLINQICDHALLAAYREGRKQVDRPAVEEAWADLQQLPVPWAGKKKSEAEAGAIEFGTLDEEAAEPIATEAAPSGGACTAPTEVCTPPTGACTRPADICTPSSDICTPSSAFLPLSSFLHDGSKTPAPEPAKQIEQIEELLSGLDDPPCGAGVPPAKNARIWPAKNAAGMAAPQESVFEPLDSHTTSCHPFDEPFEEEELVVDRFIPVTAWIPPNPAAPLSIPDAPPPIPTERPLTQDGPPAIPAGPLPPAKAAAAVADVPLPIQADSALISDGLLDDAEDPAVAMDDDAITSEPSEDVERSLPRLCEADAEEAEGEEEPDDEPQILLEDDYDESAQPLVCPLPTARRQDYRRLFSRLRRG